ncbi:Gfo/Idh/MocA family protein [Oceanomicrobium pacificus]|uniref:Gfo/Idh/MocA family oxidoreductase n=1 Tax=Oceanomicrobium pacificus TaxID=2692916 RepID=A0A6B0TY42_9RHOB|nr:Gfo/Idh/MocA family oxidoreductase [Oceanomicrobium pacificus]MXU66625.1 Gfo/Idh/MocA family oxidoreductase [Oceanomicrobium pacificus]
MSFPKDPIRVACLGAGYFSRFHYDAWARIDRARPVASVNRDITKAEATGLPAYARLDEMLAAETPDLLDIITPPETHLQAICTALDHGVRAIICQKPFCKNIDEAREAVALARAADVPLIVHENFRFQPWYRTMRRAIDEGAIGEVHQITFRLRTGDGQGPRAYLDRQPYFQDMPRFLIHETAVHWIDTFRYLLGEPDRMFADLRRLNPAIKGEDAGYLLMSYADGRRALFDGNRLLDHAADNPRTTLGECLVEGSTGTLTLDGWGRVARRAFGAAEAQVILDRQDWPGFAGDCVHALQTHVISGLLDGTPLENRAEDYLKNILLEDAAYASDAAGRQIEV